MGDDVSVEHDDGIALDGDVLTLHRVTTAAGRSDHLAGTIAA